MPVPFLMWRSMPDYRLHWDEPGTGDGRLLMQGLDQDALSDVFPTQRSVDQCRYQAGEGDAAEDQREITVA
jgi:hypothetical protein